MFIVELVVQGVRGIRELARLRFQSGFNFVAAGNESGKTTSVDAVVRLLFPSNEPQAINPLVSKYTPDASRAALVACSDDGAYYRVIEDFSKRAVNLSKYNAATKEFTLMHKDWDSTARFLSGLESGISEEEYNRLYVFRREQYANRSGPSVSLAPRRPAPVRPAAPSKGKATPQQARLAELRETLRKADEAADADYKAQSGKLKLDEVRKKLNGIEEINNRYTEAAANVSALKGCAELPANLNEVIEEHERRQSQKMTEVDELNKEIAGLQMQIDAVPQVNLVTDPLFIAGVAAAMLSIIVALFMPTMELAGYFPIGVLAGITLIAAAWYRGSQKGNERKLLAKEVEGLQTRLVELEKSFEQGGAEIMACMTATGSATTTELREKAENYRYFLSIRDDIDEQRKRILGDVSPEDLQAELGKLQQEVAELEKAARGLAHQNLDAYAIRQEIERLEQEMSGGATADFSGGQEVSDDFSFSAPSPEPDSGSAGFLAEIGLASRIGGIEMETLIPAVEAAAQRNLSAITGGRYVRIEAGHEGDPVVHAQDDSPLGFSELSHATKDLIYFCLRAGLVEAISGKRRLPFLLDDPLAGFDPVRQQAACQILRSLGAKTQVLLFSSNPALKAEGEAAAVLK